MAREKPDKMGLYRNSKWGNVHTLYMTVVVQ